VSECGVKQAHLASYQRMKSKLELHSFCVPWSPTVKAKSGWTISGTDLARKSYNQFVINPKRKGLA
jgi:hypothetical protein